MTSRRSIQGYAQRQSRALQFVPGHVGGRVASAQPVERRARIGSAGVATTGPLYWWTFDEASGTFAETNGGTAIGVVGSTTYHATALAPGSTYATTLASGAVAGTGYLTTGLGAGTDGLIVVDFWVDGVAADTDDTTNVMVLENQTSGGWLAITFDPTADGLAFFFDGDYVVPVFALDPWTLEPAHIRWEIDPAAGSSTVIINGTTLSATTGHTTAWDSADAWKVTIGAPYGAPTTFDELKIYGVEV